jgi:endonuclease YncB( thermonuclease family)
MRWIAFGLLLAIVLFARPAGADELPPYRYDCTVVHATDGDTLLLNCPQWPPGFEEQGVRIDGVDTAESRRGPNGAKCAKEVKLGKIAKAFTKRLIAPGEAVTVVVRQDRPGHAAREKFGRLLGDVIFRNKSLRDELISNDMARPYGVGKGKDALTKQSWCS